MPYVALTPLKDHRKVNGRIVKNTIKPGEAVPDDWGIRGLKARGKVAFVETAAKKAAPKAKAKKAAPKG